MKENEVKRNWWPIAFISFGSAIAAFTACFGIYYGSVFPKLFVSLAEDPKSDMVAGIIALISAALLFGLAFYVYAFAKKDRSLMFGAIMVLLTLAIIICSFFIRQWYAYAIAGIFCLIGALSQMFDLRRALPDPDPEAEAEEEYEELNEPDSAGGGL